MIIHTIAQALGLAESPDRLLFDSFKAFLCDRQMLPLIENSEQVISAAPLPSQDGGTIPVRGLAFTWTEACCN